MKYWTFVVDDNTWPEHLEEGVAGINTPDTVAKQQEAIAELMGVRPPNRIFFNIRVSEIQPSQILGHYEAIAEPFYNPGPLFSGARFVGQGLPYDNRNWVGFRQITNYERPLDISENWLLRERGLIRSIQQSCGDTIGCHACLTIKITWEI